MTETRLSLPNKPFVFFVGVTMILVSICSAAEYRKEAEDLAAAIVTVHPNGLEIARTAEFQDAKNALLAMAENADYPHYAMAAGRLFNAADDGHTAFIAAMSEHSAFTSRYPILVERFEGGLYVTAAKGVATPLLGARITRIGDQPINEIVRMFTEVSSGGSPAWPMNFIALVAMAPGWLMGFDVIDTDLSKAVTFEGESPDGQIVTAALIATPDGRENRSAVDRKLSPIEKASSGASNFVFSPEDNECLLVAHIGVMDDEDGKSFQELTDEVTAALEIPCLDRIVLDLRRNGGGNNQLTKPLHRALVKSRLNRPGGMYILISPNTFSAAMNFATRLERETDAVFVGEPTGGSPNHFGDAQFKTAPASGTPYLISTLRWQDSSPFDNRKWILPDVPASPTFTDYLSGKDRALEAAISHEVGETPATDWRPRVIKPWQRESQKQQWRFFYERSAEVNE